MNIILGFGSTEKEQRKITFDKAREILKRLCKKYPNSEYSSAFNNDVFNEFKKEFEEYTKAVKKEYDKADKSDNKSERYYHINYGQRIALNYDTIFIAINFWHINSKHPLSPDGMALLKVRETETIYYEEVANS